MLDLHSPLEVRDKIMDIKFINVQFKRKKTNILINYDYNYFKIKNNNLLWNYLFKNVW
jgi:hypothetical protein